MGRRRVGRGGGGGGGPVAAAESRGGGFRAAATCRADLRAGCSAVRSSFKRSQSPSHPSRQAPTNFLKFRIDGGMLATLPRTGAPAM